MARTSRGKSSSGRSSSRGKSSSKGRSSSRGKSSSGSKSSSKGRSSSKSSKGRSSSGSKSSGKKSTARKSSSRASVSSAARSKTTSRVKATKRTTVGTPARRIVNVRQTRTPKTVSPLRKTAKRPTSKAQPTKRKPIIVKRRITRTVSPPVYKKKSKKTAPVSNITKGASFSALQQAQARARKDGGASAQFNFNNQILGRKTANTIPVRVNFASGARMMYLGAPAIRAYEAQGLKVTGVSMTIKNGTMYPTPPIQRIRDKTDRWANNPPPLLTVPKRAQAKAPSPRGKNNVFKQKGSNPNSTPWDPLGDLMGMFDNSPQQAPQDQYLPPAEDFDYPRPVYDAFANDQGFYQSPQPVPDFNSQIQTDTFDFKAELLKLKGNKYVIYGLVGLGILIGIKIVLR